MERQLCSSLTHAGTKYPAGHSAFTVLSQSIDLHGVAFREAAQQIASTDTLLAFMKDFSKRHDAPRS